MSENGEDNGGEERVHEWEMGLPSVDDLTPLSQPLIPPELASAFSISPEPYRTFLDVNRASRNTLSSLRGGGGGGGGGGSSGGSSNNNNRNSDDPIIVEEEEEEEADDDDDDDNNIRVDGSESRKMRKLDNGNEETECVDDHDQSARTVKRPRLVWTPQLHKRFVDVVGHLGIKNAVPKTIMQLMNVEGLTRENVASHLQKYRLYLKRMQGGSSTQGLSSSDQLFASTPVPQSLQDSGGASGGVGGGMQMMQMPVYGGMHMGNQYHPHPHHHHGGFEASSYRYYPQHHHHRIAPNDNK